MSAVSSAVFTIPGTRYELHTGGQNNIAIVGKDMIQCFSSFDNGSLLVVLEGNTYASGANAKNFTNLKNPPPSYKQPGGIQKVVLFTQQEFNHMLREIQQSNKDFLEVQAERKKIVDGNKTIHIATRNIQTATQDIHAAKLDIHAAQERIEQNQKALALHQAKIAEADRFIAVGKQLADSANARMAQNAIKEKELDARKATLLQELDDEEAMLLRELEKLEAAEKQSNQSKLPPSKTAPLSACTPVGQNKSAAK